MSFNPRARDERDQTPQHIKSQMVVSIHALVMSATEKVDVQTGMTVVSIHALVMSATFC